MSGAPTKVAGRALNAQSNLAENTSSQTCMAEMMCLLATVTAAKYADCQVACAYSDHSLSSVTEQ